MAEDRGTRPQPALILGRQLDVPFPSLTRRLFLVLGGLAVSGADAPASRSLLPRRFWRSPLASGLDSFGALVPRIGPSPGLVALRRALAFLYRRHAPDNPEARGARVDLVSERLVIQVRDRLWKDLDALHALGPKPTEEKVSRLISEAAIRAERSLLAAQAIQVFLMRTRMGGPLLTVVQSFHHELALSFEGGAVARSFPGAQQVPAPLARTILADLEEAIRIFDAHGQPEDERATLFGLVERSRNRLEEAAGTSAPDYRPHRNVFRDA